MESISVQPINLNDNLDEGDDANLRYSRAVHIEPFHRQRRIDGTLPFSEQIATMQHIILTNGIDGRYTYNDNLSDTEMKGGIWKEVIHNGIGQKPTTGACV